MVSWSTPTAQAPTPKSTVDATEAAAISPNECLECGEGMICRGMGTLEIEKGYFSEVELSVYRCHGDTDRCIGGLPGYTCAPGRKGKTCAECEDGKTPGDKGACKECGGSDTSSVRDRCDGGLPSSSGCLPPH